MKSFYPIGVHMPTIILPGSDPLSEELVRRIKNKFKHYEAVSYHIEGGS